MPLMTSIRTAMRTPRTLVRIASVFLLLNFGVAALSRHADPRWTDLLDAAQGFSVGVSIPLMLMAVRLRAGRGHCASHQSLP